MESLMKRFFIILSLFFAGVGVLCAQETKSTRMIIGIEYFKEIMGNVHQNPDRYSQVLTTISCNYPVKILDDKSKSHFSYDKKKWSLVRVGPYEGYVLKGYLNSSKNICFEEQYPKFFDGLELEISELYYWARLYDQFVQEKTQVTK